MQTIRRRSRGCVLLLALPLAIPAVTAAPAPADEPAPAARPALPEPPADMPESFQQLLPRGRIASVDAPVFVSADEAEIADDAWVLGVVVDGVAKAYSLNLLNRHEIVNDTFGDAHVAAVW